MVLPIQSFSQLVENQAAAIEASSTQLTDFQVGSILRAIIESNAGNSIWIQSLISALLAVARLQTSSGNDVDTFINQFGFTRPGPIAATGNVTFGRTITTSISSIPASTTQVQTSINQTVFQTYVDTDNPAYDAPTNSYLMGLGVSTLTVPVQCLTKGAIGNVQVGAIDTINSALINVNTVNNAAAFTTGSDQATDAQTKIDFVLYLQGLSKATLAAIASAVVSVSGVTRYKIVENVNESSVVQLGYFYVVIDNGLGTISDAIRDQVFAAVDLVRGLSIQFNIDKATPHAASGLTATLIVPVGTSTATKAAITATIKSNVLAFMGTIPIGGTFYFTRVSQILYDASSLISDVYMVTLNGSSSADFESTALQVPTIVPSTIVMTYVNP